MRGEEQELDRLLGLIDQHVDLEHCRKVDERYRLTLDCKDVDRPPLVVQVGLGPGIGLPAPWDEFRHYGYREAFDSPVKMLQNMLLNRVVPGVFLKDDSPLAVRNDHGTIQIASVLGGRWAQHEENYPWIERFPSREPLERIAASQGVDLAAGVVPQSVETLRFYGDKLAEYSVCREAIQVSLPDLQGPLDTAELLWGSEIYYAFYDGQDLLARLLTKIVDTMLVVSEHFRGHTADRLDPTANTQHGYMIPGRLLIRDDSAIMLSPEMYAEFVQPHDARLLQGVGKGAVHFCGNGQHLIDDLLEVPGLLGVDLGQPELMDVQTIYSTCRERGVVLTNICPSREDLVGGKALRDFPTGCVLAYAADDLADAAEVVNAYQSCRS